MGGQKVWSVEGGEGNEILNDAVQEKGRLHV